MRHALAVGSSRARQATTEQCDQLPESARASTRGRYGAHLARRAQAQCPRGIPWHIGAEPALEHSPTHSITYAGCVRVSTRGDYACRALLSLTLHADTGCPTSVRDIAERTGLPQPYLEQILLALKGAGLVRSKRGVGGGYVLAKSPADIKLSDIISAVDGPITLGDFGQPHQDGSCDHEGQCVLLAIWDVAGHHMRDHLDAYTLETISSAATGTGPWPKVDPHHHH